MRMKIYIAGALFNEGEVRQRKMEGEELRKTFGDRIELFNPIDQPFNENKQSLPTPLEIFEGDDGAVKWADLILADVTNEDAGVMAELGIASALQKEIIAVNSDIRLKSANKYGIPSYGMNHFILGLIEKHGKLVTSFSEAVEELKRRMK